jgi:UDP-N-acetylmuramoyl-L-alanyl-D-glutamate--2,6-diaminopimelate ligase
MGRAPQTPGRLEGVENSSGFAVYVDYAHTPDALDRVLETLRAVTEGRLLCLFGCGGDRDRTKRPRMAAAAAKWADLVVVTADNSRSEKTEAILDAIEAGFPPDWRRGEAARVPDEARRFVRVEDREEAIRWIVDAARPGDVVILAGKGHERTQTIGGSVAAFDDREVARRALLARVNR